MSGYPVKMTVHVEFSDGSTHDYEVGAVAQATNVNGRLLAGWHHIPLERPADYYFNQPRWLTQPLQLGFAGPKVCHRTASGIMVHVKPSCRCPAARR